MNLDLRRSGHLDESGQSTVDSTRMVWCSHPALGDGRGNLAPTKTALTRAKCVLRDRRRPGHARRYSLRGGRLCSPSCGQLTRPRRNGHLPCVRPLLEARRLGRRGRRSPDAESMETQQCSVILASGLGFLDRIPTVYLHRGTTRRRLGDRGLAQVRETSPSVRRRFALQAA